MKRIYLLLTLSLLGITVLSCKKETTGGESRITFTATSADFETKTSLTGGKTVWSSGDQIVLVLNDGSTVKSTLTQGVGTAKGTYIALIPEGKTVVSAVYPADAFDSADGNTVNVILPSAQDGTFAAGNIAVAKLGSGNTLSFKNVTALITLKTPAGSDVKKIEVSSISGAALSGTIPVDCSGAVPVAMAAKTPASTVSIPVNGAGLYYVAVAAGTVHNEGLKISYTGTETIDYNYEEAVTFDAGALYNIESEESTAGYYVSLDGAGDKSGKNWANAMDAAKMWGLITLADAKPEEINDVVFKVASGTYDWAAITATDIPTISIAEEQGPVKFTVMGGFDGFTGLRDLEQNPTVFTGAGTHPVLVLAGGTLDVVMDGIQFTEGKSESEGGGIKVTSGTWTFTNCEFSANEADYGGAIYIESAKVQIFGGKFESNVASGNGGAIQAYENSCLEISDYEDSPTLFLNNSSDRYGGAIDFENSNAGMDNRINNAIFKGNHAQWGGAISVYGKDATTKVYVNACTFGGTEEDEPNYTRRNNNSKDADGGAIYAEDDSYVNVGSSIFVNNNAKNCGGAISVEGYTMMQLSGDSFIGNYSSTGGAVFAKNRGNDYPNIFVDGCSFDANYITNHYGCTINFNGIDSFCMHNSSVRGSYVANSKTGEESCWIDLDAVQGKISISNSSIIGAAASSSLVWSCNGSWTNYFTNNIIVQEDGGQQSIHSDGSALDVSYTIYSASTSIAAADNNAGGKASGDIDGLAWSDEGSSSYYWKWNGTISGSAPAMPEAASVTDRVTQINEAFVLWSGSDFGMDQRHVARAGAWWPGAYQK